MSRDARTNDRRVDPLKPEYSRLPSSTLGSYPIIHEGADEDPALIMRRLLREYMELRHQGAGSDVC
jgi:hypothetical protein